jgi:hypothetical protein
LEEEVTITLKIWQRRMAFGENIDSLFLHSELEKNNFVLLLKRKP